MSASVIKQMDLLKVLNKSGPKMRKAILKVADRNLIKSILECIQNCILGNVPLKSGHKSRLSRHKHTLRKLIKKGDTWQKKKKILQRGGSLIP